MEKESILITVNSYFDPLADAVNNTEKAAELILNLGLNPPSNLKAFNSLSPVIENLFDLLDDIDSADPDSHRSEYLELIAKLLITLVEVFKAIESFSNSIENDNDWIDIFDNVGSAADFLGLLFNFLTTHYLKSEFPSLYSSFLLIGLIKETSVDLTYNSHHIIKTISQIHWKKISEFITEGFNTISGIYGWGDDEIDYALLLYRLRYFGLSLGVYSYFDSPHEDVSTSFNDLINDNNLTVIEKDDIEILRIPFLPGDDEDIIGLEIYPLVNSEEKVKAFGIAVYLNPGFEFSYELTDSLMLNLDIQSDLNTGFGIIIQPNKNPKFLTAPFLEDTSSFIDSQTINARISLIIASPEEKLFLLGNKNGSQFQVDSAVVTFGLDKPQIPRFYFETELKDCIINISTKGSDGFISKLIPSEGFKSNFDFGIGFSNDSGVYFKGSSSLEILICSHFKLGPLEITELKLSIIPNKNRIPINLGANIKAKLGPLKVVVDNLGIKTCFTFIDNNNGNIGPVDLSFGFKPPNGVGLAIETGVVKGAGYLFIDTDRGEYAGALELTFQDFLSLKAIGLIATKMPDGSKGFSLLIIITAEFTIQIGMGFVFLGAGGLLGLHRTAKITPLAEGVRSGATANLLFPKNVVENAPQIISDIRIFFPIEENHLLIGPMIKLGWGQPPLISLALGIIIEIRTDAGGNIERIAILGVLKCILPEEKAAILVLQVNFIGAVDFTKKTGFFFASIFESRVLFITIEGEMGLLVAWGDDSNFVVSVGGFHPRFNPPPLPFPVPKRVSLSILNKSWGKIRVLGYFAVTTNTVQFGAKIEVKFGIDDFKIDGHLAFDVLFQFNPFFFIVEISGKVSLKVFGAGLFSISLKFSLEGPTPWRAKGYGKIKILFFSFKARFDKKWGKSKNTTLQPIEIIPILLKELNNFQNWETIAPASRNILVTLRDLPEESDDIPKVIRLHPIGKIKISQRAVIMKKKIDLVGSQKPSDANYFELQPPVEFFKWGDDTKESFASAQYFKMKSSNKLSEPATRRYVGGGYLEAKNSGVKSHTTTVRHVRYELFTIDTAYKRVKQKFYRGMRVLFGVFLGNNAAAKSTISNRQKKESQPFVEKIKVMEGSYSVAYAMNNLSYSQESANFESQWEAEDFINKEVEKNNIKIDELHVIPNNEVNIMSKAA